MQSFVMRALVLIAATGLVVATSCKDPACAPRERPDAARAAFEEIETMTRYIRRQGNKGVGLDDRDGQTEILLSRILDSPDASDYLVRLAHSKNAVSRMAAAEGFGIRLSKTGRSVLEKLKTDQATAQVIDGEESSHRSVSEFARRSLMRYSADAVLPTK